MLTELRDRDGIKAIADYAGLPSTSKETKVLAPLSPPEVLTLMYYTKGALKPSPPSTLLLASLSISTQKCA